MTESTMKRFFDKFVCIADLRILRYTHKLYYIQIALRMEKPICQLPFLIRIYINYSQHPL